MVADILHRVQGLRRHADYERELTFSDSIENALRGRLLAASGVEIPDRRHLVNDEHGRPSMVMEGLGITRVEYDRQDSDVVILEDHAMVRW